MKSITASRSFNICDEITEAASCINQLYPLTNFVACNSLKGYENIPFEEAMRKAKELFDARGFLPLSEYRAMYESGRISPADLNEAFRRHHRRKRRSAKPEPSQLSLSEMFDRTCKTGIVEIINKQLIKWCGAFLDQTQAQWAPIEKRSLYQFWKQSARHDQSLWWHGVKNFRETVEALPENSEAALELQLKELEIHGENVAPYFRRHLIQLPGFASYLKWQQTDHLLNDLLSDYLAIRLHYEIVLSKLHALRYYKSQDLGLIRPILESETSKNNNCDPKSDDDYAPIWQEAYELNYRNRLLSKLVPESSKETADYHCQLVFCIDVRSEPLRRELEQRGPYSTYGFAGFFGMPMRLKELGSAFSLDLCPVLLKPEKQVKENARFNLDGRILSWQALKASALHVKKKVKSNLAGAFGLIDLLGLYSAFPLAAKTFFPSQTKKFIQTAERVITGSVDTELDLSSFSLQDKISLAEGAINGIGLSHFCKLIVLCGHKSSSVNNPFASSLDCGACGGNGGIFNARLAAEILNDKTVRAVLSTKGVRIEPDTVFIAAEHDTTTDNVRLFQPDSLDEEQQKIIEKLKEDLELSGNAVRKKRSGTLPQSNFAPLNEPFERACDWAQTAPEWGLAGNAAFIAAPRDISSDTDLEGRVFLHSYDCNLDKENSVLELIMTAPLVVAQWINAQYYLSTVDNENFGSGTKTVHNVLGDFGVMSGAASDLRLGLPLQSITSPDGFGHEPMRLLAIIRARRSAIEMVLQKHSEIAQLVNNRWIRLVALEPEEMRFYELNPDGEWYQINTETGETEEETAANPLANGLRAGQTNATSILRKNHLADHKA